MSLDIAGICSDTWNIVINVTEHWMGKSRKLEIAKCGKLLGKCYFAVHHKSNTEMLPLVTYTCCCFYAHEKGLKLRKPSSKLNNTTIIILVLVSSLLKGRVFLLTFKTTQNSKTTPYIKKKKNYSGSLHLSVHIWEDLEDLRIHNGGFKTFFWNTSSLIFNKAYKIF